MTASDLHTDTILTQIFILFCLTAVGFICGKTRYLHEQTGPVISKYIVRISMPAMILSKFLTADFTKQEYLDGAKITLISVASLTSIYLISAFACKYIYKLENKQRNVYCMQSMFGNVIFFAFPLFLALFGDKGVIFALFFNMGSDTFLWTCGVNLASAHDKKNRGSQLKRLLNANTIAFAIGLLLMVFSVGTRLGESGITAVKASYNVVYTTLNMIGASTSPLSMIFIGIVLSGVDKRIFAKGAKALLGLAAQKLIIMPLVIGAVLYILNINGLVSDIVMMIAVLQIAMPTGTLTSSLAYEYNSDYEMAAKGVFITTLFSVVTLPLVSAFLKFILTRG